jgi:tripartite-type tricarboxylate transporter receptor subunit TctC
MTTHFFGLNRLETNLIGLTKLLIAMSVTTSALAADYPTRTITVINPWTAGGPADTVARPILQKLSDALKQPVVL